MPSDCHNISPQLVGIEKGQNESPVKRIFVFVQCVQFFDISLCILRSVKSMKKHRKKPTTQKEMVLTAVWSLTVRINCCEYSDVNQFFYNSFPMVGRIFFRQLAAEKSESWRNIFPKVGVGPLHLSKSGHESGLSKSLAVVKWKSLYQDYSGKWDCISKHRLCTTTKATC